MGFMVEETCFVGCGITPGCKLVEITFSLQLQIKVCSFITVENPIFRLVLIRMQLHVVSL